MREIKFRAWDTDRQRMRTGSDNLMLDLGGRKYWQFGYDLNFLDQSHAKEFVLMQYTGLHDKNGVEIYEGDIVKTDENDWVGKVVYEAPEFALVDNGFGFASLGYCETKVIGNIYENPELMR